MRVPDLHVMNRGGHIKRATCTGIFFLGLLVRLIIGGLLAGFIAPHYFKQFGKSKVKVAHEQINALTKKALEAHRLVSGRAPSTARGLSVQMTALAGMQNWLGPYPQESCTARLLGNGVPLSAARNAWRR